MTPDNEEGVRVQLARMEGKLDLSNLRHDQHDARFSAVEGRLHGHGERISGLEGRERERTGERKSAISIGRAMWATVSLLAGSGIGAALMKLLGQ